MTSMQLAFSVVFPLFIMMALGYILRVIKLFDEDFLTKLNNLCFKTFLPIILFVNIYRSDFKGVFRGDLIIFALVSIIIAFLILIITIPKFVKKNIDKSVVIQGIFRSNFVLFGMPMAASLYGDENTSITAILLAFVIPLYNTLAVITLETYSSQKSSLKSVIKGIIKNPMIIASVIAMGFVLTEIKLPIIFESTLIDISKISTPLALIVLGGSFQFLNLFKSAKLLTFSIISKLLLLPLIFMPIAILFGFRNVELASLLAMYASPTAISSYAMAQSNGANHELAGQIIVVSSTFSIFTIFLWITILKQMNLI